MTGQPTSEHVHRVEVLTGQTGHVAVELARLAEGMAAWTHPGSFDRWVLALFRAVQGEAEPLRQYGLVQRMGRCRAVWLVVSCAVADRWRAVRSWLSDAAAVWRWWFRRDEP